MIKLRRKIVVWFLVITFAAGILNAVVDGVFDIFMQSFEPDEAHILISAAVVLLISIVIFVMSGVVFYLIVKKAVQEESERQVREKDLIYAAVAHDLKTPMTSVQGFAKALSDGKILPEDQQEAYIAAHYRPGTAEAAMVSQASDISKYLEPLQPLIDKWGEVGEKADAFLAQANEKCKGVYKKYASELAKASDKERVSILLKYYAEIVEYQRTAVQQAMRVRLDEQLPIAEDIEKKMVTIRAEHPDIVSAFMNYPQLTATQYFADVAKLIEVPEFND